MKHPLLFFATVYAVGMLVVLVFLLLLGGIILGRGAVGVRPVSGHSYHLERAEAGLLPELCHT